jgi:hypothetical protein
VRRVEKDLPVVSIKSVYPLMGWYRSRQKAHHFQLTTRVVAEQWLDGAIRSG